MQSYCAPHMGLCLNYSGRKYSEMYIGVLVIMIIFFGIPTCVYSVECLLTTKFCQRIDEQTDAKIGGMTICECITYICTCGSAFNDPKTEADEYLEKYKIEDEVEGEEGAAVVTVEDQAAGDLADKAGADDLPDF